jgi:hypothetical protein
VHGAYVWLLSVNPLPNDLDSQCATVSDGPCFEENNKPV